MIIVPRSIIVEEPPGEITTRFTHHARQGVGVFLTGVDGSVWDLVNGPVLMQEGARLAYADPEHKTRQAPSLDGATWQGFRTPPGELFLPVRVTAVDSLEWRDVDSAFATAVDPSGEVTVTVITPDSMSRTVTGRYAEGLDASLVRDPLLLRHAVYGMTFDTLDPFWRSPKNILVFGVVEGTAFFPGPPWVLNPGSISDTSTVTNQGSVPVWPKWTITGPYTSVTIGVGDDVVTLDTAIIEGESRVIDMDPRERSIVDEDGNDVWIEATDAAFASIPVGVEIPLSIDVADGDPDTTTVTVEFTPGHRKPW